MVKVINFGFVWVFVDDLKVLLMGEDIVILGGVFWVIEGLKVEFGEYCIFDILLVELVIVGMVIGLVMCGFCLVCEIQFDGFIFFGFDQIILQFVKFIYCYEGFVLFFVVICVLYGGYIGVVEYY